MAKTNVTRRLRKQQFQPLRDSYSRLSSVVDRCFGLMTYSLYGQESNAEFYRNQAYIDMLLASVVLLHGGFEDFLRSLGRILLPGSSPGALNRIPIFDSSNSSPLDTKKFQLGDLLAFDRITVHELICMSIDRHLDRRTFNSTGEVVAFLADAGVSIDFGQDLSKIAALMKRRHEIVHQADFSKPYGHDLNVFEEKTLDRYHEWPVVIRGFAVKIVSALAPKGLAIEVERIQQNHAEGATLIRESISDASRLIAQAGGDVDAAWEAWVRRHGKPGG